MSTFKGKPAYQEQPQRTGKGNHHSHSHWKGKGNGRVSRQVDVPAKHLGAIIGKAGVNLRNLQAEFGVQIRVPQPDSSAGALVTILGWPDACEQCEKRIHALSLALAAKQKQHSLRDQPAPIASNSDVVDTLVRKINVPSSRWGAIIGKGGTNLRNLQEEFGVQIRVPRVDDPLGSMVTISGSAEACQKCEERLQGSATSLLNHRYTNSSVPASAPDAQVLSSVVEMELRVVSVITGETICTVGADRCWHGVQVKVSIQQATRIPCVQHKLFLNGMPLGDHEPLANQIGEGSQNVEIMFLRLNPTKKLYWKIALSDAHSDLHRLGSEITGFFVRPYFHVKLLEYDADGTNTSDECVCHESTLEQLSGEGIEVSVTAVAKVGPAVLGKVELPENVRCATSQMPVVVLADKEISICTNSCSLTRGSNGLHLGTANWKPLPKPVIVRGIVELKATWPSEEIPEFFDPSRAPSASNMERRINKGNAGRDSFSAAIIDGRWVSVKQHSSMGAAIILFKVQQHRGLLLSRFSKDPLIFCGTRIDIKAHMEKQVDGTCVEIPSCAFAGWKRKQARRRNMAFDTLSLHFPMQGFEEFMHMLDAPIADEHILTLFDHLCECC